MRQAGRPSVVYFVQEERILRAPVVYRTTRAMPRGFDPQRSSSPRCRTPTDRRLLQRLPQQIKKKNDTKVLKYVEPKSPLVRPSTPLVPALADDALRSSNKILEQ